MNTSFICPFCNKGMTTLSSSKFICTEHGFIVEPANRAAYFDSHAPAYLLESQKFLDIFKETDPDFVMSFHELFSKQFKLRECKFINVKQTTKAADVICMDIGKLNVKLDIVDRFLIAGKGLIADTIGPYFKNSLLYSAENNPLVFTSIPDSSKWLWLKVVLATNPIVSDDMIDCVTNAYFAPTLEQKISWLTNTFDVELTPLSNEEMLYSHIVTEPWRNVQWGIGKHKLLENVKSFIRACLNDIDLITDEPIDDVRKLPAFIQNETKWLDMYKKAYYNAMPSTAINQGVDGVFVTFDILNHEFSCNYFAGQKVNGLGNEFVALYNAWLILSALYGKYCRNDELLGYNRKIAWIASHNCDHVPVHNLSPNMLIVRFWQIMGKYLFRTFYSNL